MKCSEIPAGSIQVFVAPNLHAMICGVYRAGFHPDGRVTLVYVDESRETAQFTQEEAEGLMAKAEESIFPVVSAVQAKRPAEGGK